MKNTILKFKSTEVDIDLAGFERVQDYHDKKIDIWTIPEVLVSGMLDVYQMEDDDRLERISFHLYGTPDYWDLLSLLNENDPLFDMPYNEEILRDAIEKKVRIQQNFDYSHAPLIQSVADDLKKKYTTETLQKNEDTRILTVVKPSRINDFMALLKDNNFT